MAEQVPEEAAQRLIRELVERYPQLQVRREKKYWPYGATYLRLLSTEGEPGGRTYLVQLESAPTALVKADSEAEAWPRYMAKAGVNWPMHRPVISLAADDAAPPEPAQANRRPCYERDQLWLKWHEEEDMRPAAIRNRWNKEHPKEKVGEGKTGLGVVVKGLNAARRDREKE